LYEVNADEIEETVRRVESDLYTVVFPYAGEWRYREGLPGEEQESFGVVLGKLRDARNALDERRPSGKDLDSAMQAIREARDALDLVHDSRLPDDEARTAWADAKRVLGNVTGQGP
jgi:hypothetical protein